MESAGIIWHSSSPWLSPLHMVKKPDGSWRPCGNYRHLNTQTVPDRYPLPNVADFSSRLHGSKVFTKLDLTKGYYQVPMFTGDIPQKQWMHLPKAYGSYFPRTPSLFCIRCWRSYLQPQPQISPWTCLKHVRSSPVSTVSVSTLLSVFLQHLQWTTLVLGFQVLDVFL